MKKVNKIRKLLDNNFVYFFLLIILLAGAIFGLILVKKFTGFAGTQVPAAAGTITTVLIDDRQTSSNWAGLFGLTFSQSGFNETQSATLTTGTISIMGFAERPGTDVLPIW